MTPGEYTKSLDMLHALEGLELYLDGIKARAKSIEPKKRGDMLICIQAAERVRRHLLENLHDLLGGSEQIEADRRERTAMLVDQAKAQGRTEALDQLAAAIAEQRRAAESRAMSSSGKLRGKAGRQPG